MAQRILVVDDQPENLRLLKGMLGPYGYSIGSASSGDDALRLAAADPPDLILLDVVMPGISGYEVCRRMRASEPTKFVPIVMVTANPDQDRIAALDAGADDFVVRPFDRQELLARVRSLLRLKSYHDTIEQLNRTLEARVAAQVVVSVARRALHPDAPPCSSTNRGIELFRDRDTPLRGARTHERDRVAHGF